MTLHGAKWQGCKSNVWLQEVLGEENADQVAVNFFGDGTCNVGESPLTQPCMCSQHCRALWPEHGCCTHLLWL